MAKYYITYKNNDLMHHGIKGQRWGVRRYQNPDGSLTPAGQKRYANELEKALSKDNTKSKSRRVDAYGGRLHGTKQDVALYKFRNKQSNVFDSMASKELKDKERAYNKGLSLSETGASKKELKAAVMEYKQASKKYAEAYSAAIDRFLGDLGNKKMNNSTKTYAEYIKGMYYLE